MNYQIIEHPNACKINIESPDHLSPFCVYILFITDEILDKIVLETHRYAQQESKQITKTPTDKDEIKKFFSVVIIMGLVELPHLYLYWSKNPLYHNKFISSVLTRDRFLLILQYLHFNDNNSLLKSNNRLYQIRPMLNMINKNKKIMTPRRNIVIDESMVPWRGRLGIRQYIKNKRHKYGVKMYKLCTVTGYTYSVNRLLEFIATKKILLKAKTIHIM